MHSTIHQKKSLEKTDYKFEIKRYIFEHTSEQEAELKDKCLRHIRKCRNFERILKDESYFNQAHVVINKKDLYYTISQILTPASMK